MVKHQDAVTVINSNATLEHAKLLTAGSLTISAGAIAGVVFVSHLLLAIGVDAKSIIRALRFLLCSCIRE